MIIRLNAAVLAALLGASGSASAAAPTKINIQGVLREAPPGPIYLDVVAGDLDGDGMADRAVVKLVCADGDLKQAYYTITSPRDSASGQATGKRQHGAVTFTKEWGPSTPQLKLISPSYDIKVAKGVRKAGGTGDWSPITLSDGAALCVAAGEAAKTITKTSSNIQNN